MLYSLLELNKNQMNEFRKDRLQVELDNLRLICISPYSYLINYFSDLRSEVDIEILRKQLIKPFNIEKNKKLKEIWIKIITRIEIFEKKCINNKFNLQAKKDRINEIEAILNNGEDDLSADKLKNAAATKKLAIFDAFEILSRIEEEEKLLLEVDKEIETKVFKGFAEGRSK